MTEWKFPSPTCPKIKLDNFLASPSFVFASISWFNFSWSSLCCSINKGNREIGTQTSVEMTSDSGNIAMRLYAKLFLISHNCSPSCSVLAMRSWLPPAFRSTEVSCFCCRGTMDAAPANLKNKCGFIGNAGIDLLMELLTTEIHVVSRSSTHRGSTPDAINFATAFAAA